MGELTVSAAIIKILDVAPDVPFGGHKKSGVGLEWVIEGLKHYCNSRSLWVWKKVFEEL